MITEKRFSSSHSAFWEQLIPMAEHYIRLRNMQPRRYLRPLKSSIPADLRGLVNEIGFRMFGASSNRAEQPRNLPDSIVDECVAQATRHINLLRRYAKKPIQPSAGLIQGVGYQEMEEACHLAERLVIFFTKSRIDLFDVFPRFSGCGWLNECEGDIIANNILFEVKAGSRAFRSVDIRQLLCYCALGFSAKNPDIRDVCLVNPRMGIYLQDSLENICQELSGRSAVEVLAEMVEYMSEPINRYWTG